MLNMSNITSSSLRKASRLCVKQVSSAGLIRAAPLSRAIPASAQWIARREYVSETKKDNAQVNVETAIRADQKALFAETSKLPENQRRYRGTTANADALISPIAGSSTPARSRLHSRSSESPPVLPLPRDGGEKCRIPECLETGAMFTMPVSPGPAARDRAMRS